MLNENFKKSANMIGEIYTLREENLGKITKELKEKLHEVSIEELRKMIDKSIENTEKKGEIIKKLNMIVENYEIKIAEYMKQCYKQGFKDAFDLWLDCTEK